MLKENTNTKLKAVLLGQNNGIFSFAIGTVENPMGKKYTSAQNLELRTKFKKLLKDGGFLYTPLIGKYGNKENSYIIYNISLAFSKIIFGEYFNQESFIWAKKEKPGSMLFEYWKKDNNSNYKLIDKQNKIINEKDADDFFSRLKDYKFKIPFILGEDLNLDFFDRLNLMTEEDQKFMVEYVEDKKTGYSTYLNYLYINNKAQV